MKNHPYLDKPTRSEREAALQRVLERMLGWWNTGAICGHFKTIGHSRIYEEIKNEAKTALGQPDDAH